MNLKYLIEWLEQQNPDAVVPHGFGQPRSYRGYYDQLAFEPLENARLGDMLNYARSALGTTFEGYKGGEYTMDEWTECWIAKYGFSGGDMIGPTLLNLWEAFSHKGNNKTKKLSSCVQIGTVRHDGTRPQIWFDGKPIFSLEDVDNPQDEQHISTFCEWLKELLKQLEEYEYVMEKLRK